ncbi:MAG: acyl-CoA synthetase FdrA [Candidatus Euphemobacter frigidus]|nr:acyl-CoA synthetase FdrA [Candidatus Euphemobacter frigidus]MDP8276013.1 acyl-CoA synthetase FdrA [Candidatus Euphemobacter frigidus]
MAVKGIKKTGEYFDSVTLMLVARSLTEMEGVDDAAVVMGTEENKQILAASGMLLDEFKDTSDTDLLIVGKAADEAKTDEVILKAEELLIESKQKKVSAGEHQPKSIEGAIEQIPDANMVIISVAGRYAGDVAMEALEKGLHVMLFSDNVSIEREKELKEYGREKDLLVMGPDCGTAIINGAPLCFANVVKRGNIGIVAASGTGLQEISCIIGNEGAGISQAIGTGGRDVKEEIGGIMFIEGIKALEADAATEVIVLVSKPPAPEVLEKVAAAIKDIKKPVVAILIGGDPEVMDRAGARAAGDLERAGLIAVALSRGESPEGIAAKLDARRKEIEKQAAEEASQMKEGQKYLRGLFSGGTLCDETQLMFKEEIGAVYSPAPIDPDFKLDDIWKSKENTVVDLGEDEFTVGRPHPMIDFLLRKKRIVEEAKDPETAVILLDVVLGYGSNMEPGQELAPAIKEAKEIAEKDGRHIAIVCSITGTYKDPQNRKKVEKELKAAGAIVMVTNAAASLLTVEIIKIRSQGGKK